MCAYSAMAVVVHCGDVRGGWCWECGRVVRAKGAVAGAEHRGDVSGGRRLGMWADGACQ